MTQKRFKKSRNFFVFDSFGAVFRARYNFL
jgi:hypothetical protein